MAGRLKSIYRLEGVEINPEHGCLIRGNQEDYLRQQSFEVLLYLLEQRERLVSKNELIEVVWRGTAVTDNALAQSIVEIRKALGDDSRQPRFIKTIPKFGYRFIGSVQEQSPTSAAEPRTSLDSGFDGTLTEARANAASGPERANGPGAHLWRPQRKLLLNRRLVALATGFAVVLLALVWLIGSQRTNVQAGDTILKEIPGKKSLAVTYFENQSPRPDMDWMSQGLADMLIADLSRSEKLNVLSSEQLYSVWKSFGNKPQQRIRLGQALEIGRLSNAETVIVGSFAAVDQRIRIDVRLYGSHDGRLLGAEHVIADNPAQILSQVDVLALKLDTRLSGGASSNSSLVQPITRSQKAFRQ